MLRAIILGPNKELAEDLYRAATQSEDFAIYGSHEEYPPFDRLIRIINHTNPNAVLIEVDAKAEALETMRDIRDTHPDIALVGYADEKAQDIAVVSEYCEVIRGPFVHASIKDAIVRAIDNTVSAKGENVHAFLPAKAGNGASVTAMNVAGALAHYWKQKVLVIEADQHSGCFGISLQIEPKHSLVEVLEGSEELREDHWSRSVTSAHGVDWLLTARGRQARRIAPWEYQRLLTFVSPLYDTVIVDLPEVINEATETVVRRASKVFVVSTPEVQALYLARRRMLDLKSREVAEECRKIVLNRFSEGERSIQEYEDVLGHKVSLTIGSDYAETQNAAAHGGLVSWDSDLGRGYFEIAKEIAQCDAAEEPPVADKHRKVGMRRFFGGG